MSQIVVAFLMTGAGIVVVRIRGEKKKQGRRIWMNGCKIREEEEEWAEFIRDAARNAELKKGSMAVTSATCGLRDDTAPETLIWA